MFPHRNSLSVLPSATKLTVRHAGILLLLGLVLAAAVPVFGEEPSKSPESKSGLVKLTPTFKWNPKKVDPLVTQWIRAAIPEKYEDNRKWGKTKEIVSGLKIGRRGLRIITRRRKKRVNHGTWKKYRIDLLNPDKLKLKYGPVTKGKSGKTRFSIAATGDLALFARLSRWERGVQLFSVGANADAKVTLDVTAEVGLRATTKSLLPAIGLDLKVLQADLRIHRFRLRRLSNLRGPLAKELGRGIEHFLKQYIRKNREKLVQKLNRSIEKKRDKLEVSLGRLFKRD